MVNRFDLASARLTKEEAIRYLPYDDATGIPIHAPIGKITWGIGFNLESCGSIGLFEVIKRYLLQEREDQLLSYGWYSSADETRKSVFLDLAFNLGVSGLVRGFPKMIKCAATGDWDEAAVECHPADPRLAGRYENLADLLRAGDTP